MAQYNYCPECNAEYFLHINTCASCDVHLETRDEGENPRERPKVSGTKEIHDSVAIKEGEKGVISELHHMLADRGYASRVIISPDCAPGKCGETFLLLLPEDDAESALRVIDEYNHAMYPEMKLSEQLSALGKCPACGFNAGTEARECPDCGLLLAIEGQEECKDDGCRT